MRVLLIGKGGREHALAWKLRQTVQHVFVVPGNGGTATMAPNVSNVENVNMYDFQGLVQLVQNLSVDLVLPGPDDIVVDGIADVFEKAGIPCFAPSKAAAELEGSKTFAKDFMRRFNIPTAEHRNFDDYDHAKEYLAAINHRIVVKASGLAAGKGVFLPETKEEADRQLHEIMIDKKFGHTEVVVEEFLSGDEISILTFSDGHTFRSLPPVQDHKRIYDGSRGSNTGGMGVYGPTDFVSSELMAQIEKDIIAPTFEGLRTDGHIFRGILFTGVMLTPGGPKVLEYNVRFGDPETQSLIPLLDTSTDLAQLCLSCTNGTLGDQILSVQQGYACNVVIASAGYPGEHRQGDRIDITAISEEVNIFHAGTALRGGQLQTAGGRVFAVCAVRDTLAEAVKAAYQGVGRINFEGKQYRSDIASRCLGPSCKEGQSFIE